MLIDDVRVALRARSTLLPAMHAEGTTCYRLFHGSVEGAPGCTLDRYGDLLLWQTFREPPDDQLALLERLRDAVEDETGVALSALYWNARAKRQQAASVSSTMVPPPAPLLRADHTASELGLHYLVDVPEQGRDPGLYLDFRAARRYLREHSRGKSVLNLFAFTCGAGVASLAGGASAVVNVDHSEASLRIGRRNCVLNGLHEAAFECIGSDALPALRQYAGMPLNDFRRGRGSSGGGRGQRGQRGRGPMGGGGGGGGGGLPAYPKLPPRQFDLVVLDPPTWTTSRFGAIDLVRDYQSMFKPCVLATKPGGTVLAVNHASTVSLEEFTDVLERCAHKAGRPLADLTVLPPEIDFPSPDGKHTTKMVLARLAE